MPSKLFQLITFIGSVTRNIQVRYLSGEALRVLFPETLLILLIYVYIWMYQHFSVLHMKSYRMLWFFRAGPAAEGDGSYEDLIHSVSFYFLKDSQTRLLRRRRGRIHDACGDNRPRRLNLKFEIRKLENSTRKLENNILIFEIFKTWKLQKTWKLENFTTRNLESLKTRRFKNTKTWKYTSP